MGQVAALLFKDSCIVTYGGLNSWLSSKGECAMKHDSGSFLSSPDHSGQQHEAVRRLMPMGCCTAQRRQPLGSTEASAALPIRSRVVLCCQGSSLVRSSLGFSVLSFHTAAIAVDVRFTMDTWSNGIWQNRLLTGKIYHL